MPEFCDAAVAVNPHQVGKPLPGPLTDRHGARHGTYRVVNRIAENGSIVTSSTSATARRFPAACNADDQRSAPASRLILPDAYLKSRQPSSHQVASDQVSRTEDRCWRAAWPSTSAIDDLLSVHLGIEPVTTATIAITAAAIAACPGDRSWSFRTRQRTGVVREIIIFAVLNGIGLLIQDVMVAFSSCLLAEGTTSWPS